MGDASCDRHSQVGAAAGACDGAHMAVAPEGARTAERAERLARAARAAEELCAALWEAMHEELRAGRAQQVAELSARLTQVCSTIGELAGCAAETHDRAAGTHDRPAGTHDRPAGARACEGAGAAAAEPAATSREPYSATAMDCSTTIEPSSTMPGPAVAAEEPVIAIRDARGEGPAAWVQAIGANLERYVRDALPFAVLLVEVLDVERLAQAESAAEIARLLAHVEGVLRQELRPRDGITLERRGRWWLTAPHVDAYGARTLAERLARTARSAAGHRGVPLEVAIGIALCPEDGRDAATLAAQADVGLYAARAAGQTLAPGGEA
jgi:GGDEF domain-containing protein